MRRIAIVVIAAVVIAAIGVFAWRIFGPGPLAFAGGSTVALTDYREANPTGVPADLAKADAIRRGEYLAKAADCMVCHTMPGGEAFAGGLAFPLPFGTLYSTNITPDNETGIGNYTDQDFLNAVRQGIRKDGARLYPAMPYTSYTFMTDADALAIKAYLFSLPAAQKQNQRDTLQFPFDQRWAMIFWSWAFNPNTRFAPNAAKSAEWNRGAYIAEALAHCGDCHTPRNLAFALDNRWKFSGAVAAGWRAYNITSDKGTGIGSWSNEEVFAYLAKGHAMGRGTASGPMGEAVDHSFNQMEPADIRALVTYLRSIPAIVSPAPATIARPAPESPKEGGAVADALGRKVFEQACASCHSWTGISALSPVATISGSRAVNDPTATNVAQIVISGTQRSASGAMSMPEFGSTYTDTEIAAVANYVTGRFGPCRVQAHGKGHCGSPRPDSLLKGDQSTRACRALLRCTLVATGHLIFQRPASAAPVPGTVVVGAVLDRMIEDCRIRSEPRHREFIDVALQCAAVHEIAGDVVEPEALPKIVRQPEIPARWGVQSAGGLCRAFSRRRNPACFGQLL
jgi:mono/diheme cytochrome c family protein